MRHLIIAITLLLSLGCGDKLPPEWEISRYQVLGVVANPPEVDPDGTVELTITDFDPAGEAVTYHWSVCLFSFGSLTNFKCIEEQLEQVIEGDGPTVTLDFGPEGLNLRALYGIVGPIPDAAGEPQTLEDGFDVYVHVVSGTASGPERSTFKRVRIRDGDQLNTNPVARGFTIDGQPPAPVEPGQTVDIRIVPDESDREIDQDGVEEGYLYQWFLYGGSLKVEFGIIGSVIEYTAADEPGVYPVFVVIRDRRGGTAIEHLEITVQ